MTRRRAILTGVFVILVGVVVSCAVQRAGAPRPIATCPGGGACMRVQPVSLDPRNARRARVGALRWLSGARLTLIGSSRLTGVSGVDAALIDPDSLHAQPVARMSAVTDEGDLIVFSARSNGAVAGASVSVVALTGPDGRPLAGKAQADAEGITLDPAGGFHVAFERDHRVWRYGRPADSGSYRAWAVEAPRARLPENAGFEGLALLPLAGRTVLAVGAEDGRVWFCGIAPERGCTLAFSRGGPAAGFQLTGLDHLPGTADLVAVYRAYDPFRGMRTIVARLHTGVTGPRRRIETLARLERPLAHGNFEGVAALENGRGGWTLYLVSDDGFPRGSPTLLLTFDYTPSAARPAS